MAAAPQIVVVGAGIIGASIAWHLAKTGARVTVVDAGAAGGVATAASFGWINANWGNPLPYFHLRRRSMAEWRRLSAELPAIRPAWTGGLMWELSPDKLDAYEREHGAWGYGIRRVDRTEAARIEPNLAAPPALALHVAEEGAVEPLPTVQALLADAERRGARLLPNSIVNGLAQKAGAIAGVTTAEGTLAADEVVLAAGVGTAALAAMAGVRVPMTTPPGLLAYSQPRAPLLNGLVQSPGLHLRQTSDGRIVAAVDFDGADPADAATVARATFDKAKAILRGAGDLAFAFHTLGYRPIPADGFPVIGRAQGQAGLYLAVTHSGITLAPAIGLFAADELLTGQRDKLLSPYGPARFG